MRPLPTSPAPAGEGRASGPLGESWQAWIGLAVGVLAVSAHSALSFGMSPLMKPITEDLGWTRTEYAGAMNLRMVLLMAFAPFAGQLVDRIGARWVLAAGALLMGVGTFGIAAVKTIGELYAWSFAIGPAQACVGSVAGSALVLSLFRRRHGLAIGILNGGDNFITGGVHIASAALLVSVGWRGALGSLGIAYMVLALLVLLALRSRRAAASDAGDGPPGAHAAARSSRGARDFPWRDPSLWLLLAAYLPVYAYITTIGIHFPAFQRDLGQAPDVASYIYGLTSFVGAFGSVAIGWFAERTSARLALSLVVAGLVASTIVFWLPVGVPGFTAWAVGYGVVNAGAVALLALVLAELYGSARIGGLMGLAMGFCMAGTIAGNFYAAAIHDHFGTYDMVWKTHTALLLLACIPVELLRRRG
jgi:MFS family permease